jgi:gliding motility-associated-like protein
LNAEGCSDTIYHTLYIDEEGELYSPPNAFSPNGDGFNDRLRMNIPDYIVSFTYRLFNRWGELIFTSSDRYEEWNGEFKGQVVDNGAYVLFLEGINDKGERVEYKSTIVVNR